MKKIKFILFLLSLAPLIAIAEYRPVFELIVGKDDDGKDILEVPADVDEKDRMACSAIAENINIMSQNKTRWGCDFPISSSSYLLNKPAWEEIEGEEKHSALSSDNQSYDERILYGALYDFGDGIGELKIYSRILKSKLWICEDSGIEYRNSFWIAEKDGTSLEKRFGKSYRVSRRNVDLILYSSRIYVVEHNSKNPDNDSFSVFPVKVKRGEITLGNGCYIQ